MRLASLLLCLALGAASAADAAPPVPTDDNDGGVTMSGKIRGEFDVKMVPQSGDAGLGEGIGRLGLDKVFRGALDATSKGQMLAFRTPVEGSAGYVAMERVDGTLAGRRGTFVLQHSGTMDRGAQHLDLAVLPDSGTGELAGLRGTMQIEIAEGKHYYVFEYSLPPK